MWPPAVNPDPTTFLVALSAWVYFGFAALFAFVGNLNPAVASHVAVVLHFLLGNVLVLLLCLSSFSVLFGNSNPGAASSGCCLLQFLLGSVWFCCTFFSCWNFNPVGASLVVLLYSLLSCLLLEGCLESMNLIYLFFFSLVVLSLLELYLRISLDGQSRGVVSPLVISFSSSAWGCVLRVEGWACPCSLVCNLYRFLLVSCPFGLQQREL